MCFITACRAAQRVLGPHLHPEIVLSAIPMALSMPGWENDDHELVARMLRRGVEQLADAGADFFMCPDNTAHIVLEKIASSLPIPGLHIADVVCREIERNGWKAAALLGTRWTMTGPVYERALAQHGIARLIPNESQRDDINRTIFDELCLGDFRDSTTARYVDIVDELRGAGADCVILGCTEIPLIIDNNNSPLPVLDSTRLLAKYGAMKAIGGTLGTVSNGWLSGEIPASS